MKAEKFTTNQITSEKASEAIKDTLIFILILGLFFLIGALGIAPVPN